MEKSKLLAVIRIRGEVNVRREIADTLKMLRLYHKNYCSLIFGTKPNLGMIKKVQDYVTFGEIDEPTLIELLKCRGRMAGNKRLPESMDFKKVAKELLSGEKTLKDFDGIKPFFRLQPPRGGFERRGIKHPFSVGGALGYRKEKINELLKKML